MSSPIVAEEDSLVMLKNDLKFQYDYSYKNIHDVSLEDKTSVKMIN